MWSSRRGGYFVVAPLFRGSCWFRFACLWQLRLKVFVSPLERKGVEVAPLEQGGVDCDVWYGVVFQLYGGVDVFFIPVAECDVLGVDGMCRDRGGARDGRLVCNFVDVGFCPGAGLVKVDVDRMKYAEFVREAGVPENESLLVLAYVYVWRGDGVHFADAFVWVRFYPCYGSEHEQL